MSKRPQQTIESGITLRRMCKHLFKDTCSVFCLVLVIGICSFLGLCAIFPGSTSTFFGRMSDIYFTDHFCSIVYSLDHPYTKYSVIYPAFINEIYEVLGIVCVSNLNANTGNLELDMFLSTAPMSICIGFLGFGLFLLFLFSKKLLGQDPTRSYDILFFLLIFTTPVYAAFSAGNCIIYSVLGTVLFVLGYNSENKWVRYMSFVAIAVAACIKLTPILFTILLLRDKRYSDFFLCGVTTILLFVVPFVVTDGTPLSMIRNILNLPASTGGSCSNFSKIGLLLSDYSGIIEFKLAFAILSYAIVAIAFFFIIMDHQSPIWIMIMMLCCVIVLGPGVGTRYLSLNMIPALILFLKHEKLLTPSNIIMSVALGISFMMLPSDLAILPTLSIIVLLILTFIRSANAIKSQSAHQEL